MFYDTDIDTFFVDYGVSATFSHSGGAPSTITVIFDNDYQVVSDGIESTAPAVTCKSAEVTTAVHGDTITVSSVAYNIIGIQPDGTGISLLVLSKD